MRFVVTGAASGIGAATAAAPDLSRCGGRGNHQADVCPRLIGPAELKYLLYTGRLIDADRALRVGLVQTVVASDRLVSEALDLVSAIASASRRRLSSASL